MNEIQLIGRWVKDHEMHYTADGKAILKNTIAINRKFDKDKADFLRVVIFDKTAQVTADYTGKGSLIAITGRVQTGSYDNQQGQKIYTTDVIANNVEFLESRNSNENAAPKNNGGYQQQNSPQQQYQAPSQQQQSYQQPSQQSQQPPQQTQSQYGQQQQNYNRTNEDPFANSKGPLIVDEDSLPF